MHNIPSYEISDRAPWRVDVAELWRYRHLVWLLAWRSIRIRYKQTVLGLLWAVVAPLAFTVIFFAFFRIVSVRPTGGLPQAPVMFLGLILWQLFSRGLTEASVSLTNNSGLITKVYFPRLALPLAAVVSSLADFAITLVLLAALLLWYAVPLSPHVLLAPLFVLHMLALTLGCGLWLAAIDGFFRDLRHAIPLLLQLGMLVSPVVYVTSSLVPEKLRTLYDLNPLVAPLEGFRWSLLVGAEPPEAAMIVKSVAITIVLLFTGMVFFNRVERSVIDRV